MSLDHLRQVIRNLEIELQDVYDEAYNDGYNDGKDEYAIKTRDQIMATFNHVEGDDQNNNFVRNFTNKDKIKYKLESCPKDIDIDYNGGSNPGWKLSCEVTSYNNNSIKVLINGEYRTFLHKKIREIRYSDNMINRAKENYGKFHNIDPDNVNDFDVSKSSAGISGWSDMSHNSNFQFHNGQKSTDKNKKRRKAK